MIYVGIDIAKLNHFAAAISSDGEILIEPFQFSNDYDGFYLLLSHLAPLDQNRILKCAFSTLSRLRLCVKITYARRRLIKLTRL